MEDMFIDYPDVVNVDQLNVMLGGGFSKNLLYKLLQSQEIKNRKVGREYRIPKKYVIEYLSK
jgi:excisionase family DNA binding protein